MHGKPYLYREEFVKKWAEYVISHEDWSRQQASFLNAQVRNARAMRRTKMKTMK